MIGATIMHHIFGLQNTIIILFSTVLVTFFLIGFSIPPSFSSLPSSSVIPISFYNSRQQMMTQITTTTFQGNTMIATTTSSLTYKNPIYRMKIQYPSDWDKLEFNQGNIHDFIVIFRSPAENALDTKLENLVIQAGNLPFENIPLEEVVKANIENLKQSLIDFEIKESTTITIAGSNPAHKIVYTHKEEEDNGKTKIMQVLMIKSDKVYLITYTAEQGKYDTYLPTIQNMINSLKITTSNNGLDTEAPSSSA
jgi:hypothetical protein